MISPTETPKKDKVVEEQLALQADESLKRPQGADQAGPTYREKRATTLFYQSMSPPPVAQASRTEKESKPAPQPPNEEEGGEEPEGGQGEEPGMTRKAKRATTEFYNTLAVNLPIPEDKEEASSSSEVSSPASAHSSGKKKKKDKDKHKKVPSVDLSKLKKKSGFLHMPRSVRSRKKSRPALPDQQLFSDEENAEADKGDRESSEESMEDLSPTSASRKKYTKRRSRSYGDMDFGAMLSSGTWGRRGKKKKKSSSQVFDGASPRDSFEGEEGDKQEKTKKEKEREKEKEKEREKEDKETEKEEKPKESKRSSKRTEKHKTPPDAALRDSSRRVKSDGGKEHHMEDGRRIKSDGGKGDEDTPRKVLCFFGGREFNQKETNMPFIPGRYRFGFRLGASKGKLAASTRSQPTSHSKQTINFGPATSECMTPIPSP